MICRNCLSRATAPGIQLLRTRRKVQSRLFSLSRAANNTDSKLRSPGPTPPLSTPLDSAAAAASSAILNPPTDPLSSCPAGTSLKGLNYHKGREDPVALPDDQYPAWLWTLLKTNESGSAETSAGDEFSKSRKQRRLAVKTAREREEKLLAEGNIEALIPEIPLQHQSVNLLGEEDCQIGAALDAVDQREEVRKAMRRERIAKIRERNYLSTL